MGSKYSPDPRDDLRHALHDTVFARESLVFNIHLPVHGTLSLSTWVHGDGLAGTASVLFEPLVGSKAVFEVAANVQMSKSADFDDWTVGRDCPGLVDS
ncbi:hypothetical protein [Nocardia vaccinii]|uniref:hypothetical protein n=1 Tax=Nocardia vaccinii TaxID=1822 RepID=UPI0008297B7B|nr:hypothetical protein [Nocardia vaccinii]